jgi:hypothetical protein
MNFVRNMGTGTFSGCLILLFVFTYSIMLSNLAKVGDLVLVQSAHLHFSPISETIPTWLFHFLPLTVSPLAISFLRLSLSPT